MVIKRKTTSFLLFASAFIVILNICGCFSPFARFYTEKIYPVFAEGIARITSSVPVAIGEILMFAGIIALLFLIVFSVVFIFKKDKSYRKFYFNYLKVLLCAGVIIGLFYSFCYTVPLQNKTLYDSIVKRKDYKIEDLQKVREMIVQNANELALDLPRDKEKRIIFPENKEKEVSVAVKKLSAEYPQLKGFCPKGKPALTSDFLDWMGIGGFTYPFTMEVQLNRYTANLYYTTLYAHELCHHFGFYTEGDAEYLSTMICVGSKNPVLQYSGYLEMFYYVDKEYKVSLLKTFGDDKFKSVYENSASLSKLVKWDIANAYKEQKELYEENKNEVLEKAVSKKVTEISNDGWEIHSELLKEYNYDGIVLMLLNHYEKFAD